MARTFFDWNNYYNTTDSNYKDDATLDYYNQLKKDYNTDKALDIDNRYRNNLWLQGMFHYDSDMGYDDSYYKYKKEHDLTDSQMRSLQSQSYKEAMGILDEVRALTGRNSDQTGDLYDLWDYMHGVKSLYDSYINQRKQSDEANAAEQKLQRESRESNISNREVDAKNAYTQNRTAGLGKGLAASIGNAPLAGQSSENYANNYGNLAQLGQSTQNDYLQKMGYVNSLNQQADNVSAGSFLNTLGSIFGGAGAGASVGGSIGGSIK